MFWLYTILLGIFLALLEIEIEGEHGWAAKLPTWRRVFPSLPLSFLRNMTGYHITLFAMILVLNHVVFIGMVEQYTLGHELFILAFHFFLIIYWDFLWFVLNPHFTLKKFQKQYVPWYQHVEWKLGGPMDYWYALSLSVVCLIIGHLFTGDSRIVDQYVVTFVASIVVIFIAIIVSPRYGRWYFFMRK